MESEKPVVQLFRDQVKAIDLSRHTERNALVRDITHTQAGGKSMPARCARAQARRVINPAQLGIALNCREDGDRLRNANPPLQTTESYLNCDRPKRRIANHECRPTSPTSITLLPALPTP
jgi:hypothetical protein